jgi:hypothetical protein
MEGKRGEGEMGRESLGEGIGGWEQDGIALSLLSDCRVLPSRPYKSIYARFTCFIRFAGAKVVEKSVVPLVRGRPERRGGKERGASCTRSTIKARPYQMGDARG